MKKEKSNNVMGCWVVSGNYDGEYIKFACIGVSDKQRDIFNLVLSTYIPNVKSKDINKDSIIKELSVIDKKKYNKVMKENYEFPIDKRLKTEGKKILKKMGFIVIQHVV